MHFNSVVFSCKFHGCHGLILEDLSLMNLTIQLRNTFLYISREMRALHAKKSPRPSYKSTLYLSFMRHLRNRSALAVNCILIHRLEVSCKEDKITSAQRE